MLVEKAISKKFSYKTKNRIDTSIKRFIQTKNKLYELKTTSLILLIANTMNYSI